ncbi:hypothetical protein [Haloferula sp.]|uniref:hypothetical protein n=1 Tax=Haloferula sp. TaxID=2497595 RepID=UPI00329D9140
MSLESFLRRLGVAPSSERQGLSISREVQHWKLDGETSLVNFLRALPKLLDPLDQFVLFLEGEPNVEDLEHWIRNNQTSPIDQIPRSVIWPRCKVSHIPLSDRVLQELVDLALQFEDPALGYHLHLYQPGRMVLEWYDALGSPIVLDPQVPSSAAHRFTDAIGFTIEKQPSEQGCDDDA